MWKLNFDLTIDGLKVETGKVYEVLWKDSIYNRKTGKFIAFDYNNCKMKMDCSSNFKSDVCWINLNDIHEIKEIC